MKNNTLDELISPLPEELKQEVIDFALFLRERHVLSLPKKNMEFTWEGALEEYNEKFTALELQKQGELWWEQDHVPS